MHCTLCLKLMCLTESAERVNTSNCRVHADVCTEKLMAEATSTTVSAAGFVVVEMMATTTISDEYKHSE